MVGINAIIYVRDIKRLPQGFNQTGDDMKQCSTEQCTTKIGDLKLVCKRHQYEIYQMRYCGQLKNCERCDRVTSHLQSRYCEFCKNEKIKHRAKILKVHSELNQAVNNGVLVKPSFCETCFKPLYLEAHHYDYSLPLAVEWLCRNCHKTRHTKKW